VRTDFALKVGVVGEKIEVTGRPGAARYRFGNLGTTMGTKEVTDLPNIGRNPFVLSTLAAGVTTGAYMQSKASGFTNPFSGTAVQIIANGSSGHNRLTLDGIPDDPRNGSRERVIRALCHRLKLCRRSRRRRRFMTRSMAMGTAPF